MTDPYHPTFAIIGAGNVASHLAKALDSVGQVKQVYSHTLCNAQELAKSMRSAIAIDDLSQVAKDADFYLISVKDDCIKDVAHALHGVHGLVMHTSGSVGLEAIYGCGTGWGVMYPLQTFSKKANVDMSQVPFFIEAPSVDAYAQIADLALRISSKVYPANSQQRASLHIAAVFACNFANHLWSIASDLLEDSGYEFNVLQPLLQTTLDKAMSMQPAMAQTGPAARHDLTIINKHLSMLPEGEKAIYNLLSQSIMSKKQ